MTPDPFSLGDPADFAALAAELLAEPDEAVTGRTVARRLTELVPDAEMASVTVRDPDGGHHTLASTDETAARADAEQYALREGPCVDAADHAPWVRSGDVGSDRRWPLWGPQARALGVASLLSVQLIEGEEPRGAINLYSRSVDRFADADTVDLATTFAVHAANALSSARQVSGLQTALTSRHVIGMAQGIVIERYGLTEHQSFELLRRLSSTGQTRLRDVAAFVVEHRRLPDLPGSPPEPE